MSRINTNVPAIQATHRLAANNADLNIRLQRLSTGLRINSGRDDPAGLIASETLRSEVRGIGQAIDNSQRAINVTSTAEGSLNEISSLLLDMRALIIHSANTGAISQDELAADQLQIDGLVEAIDRISKTTQFGGQKLINGNFAYATKGVQPNDIAVFSIYGARVPRDGELNVAVQVTSAAQKAKVILAGATGSGPEAFDSTSGLKNNLTLQIGGKDASEILTFAAGSKADAIVNAINGVAYTTGVSAKKDGNNIEIHSVNYGSKELVSVKAIQGTIGAVVDDAGTPKTTYLSTGNTTTGNGKDAVATINGQNAYVDGLHAYIRANGLDLAVDLKEDFGTMKDLTHTQTNFQITGGGALFQLGPEVNTYGQISMGIPSVDSGSLGNALVGYLNTVNTVGANAVLKGRSQEAEAIVVEAINQVAVIRGRLGALQRNQLETNINSQRIASENVQSAESAIRDADVATEVSAMTRAQILVQSTTSMISMANQMPQTALSLLKG